MEFNGKLQRKAVLSLFILISTVLISNIANNDTDATTNLDNQTLESDLKQTKEKITNITVGKNPVSISINHLNNTETSHIYVANSGSNTVSVIDGNNNTVIKEIELEGKPEYIAINNKTDKVYVANSGNVSVIDGKNNTVVKELDIDRDPKYLPSIHAGYKEGYVVINEKNNKIYTHARDNTVAVIDGNNNTVIKEIELEGKPEYIAINNKTDKVYVANSGNVSVIDGKNDVVIENVPMEFIPVLLEVGENDDNVYVVQRFDYVISVLDGKSNTVIIETEADSKEPTDIEIDSTRDKVYVSTADYEDTRENGFVSIMDGNNNTVIKEIEVGREPADIEIDTARDKVYVANEYSNTISIVDGKNNNLVSEIRVGLLPIDIEIDTTNNKVYVANRNSSSITLIESLP